MKQEARARHESLDHLFKYYPYGILECCFYHCVELRGRVFMSVANLVQAYILQPEQPTFHVDYFGNY